MRGDLKGEEGKIEGNKLGNSDGLVHVDKLPASFFVNIRLNDRWTGKPKQPKTDENNLLEIYVKPSSILWSVFALD